MCYVGNIVYKKKYGMVLKLRNNTLNGLLLSGLVLFLCTSCASHQKLNLPLESQNIAFSKSGENTLQERWWKNLKDDQLNEHIKTALSNNFDLLAAWERINAARAISRREAASLYPSLNLDADANRVINEDGDQESAFSLGPVASYEVDLWGKIRALNAAEDIRALAVKEDYHSAALTLSGNIAITWVRLIEAHKQRSLLERQIATNHKVLEVLKARFGIGQIRSEDILRQKLLIEAIEEDKIDIELAIKTLEHQLAVLRGEAPQDKNFAPSQTLPDIPALPQTGLPSDLITRRPDVRSALLKVQAADKDLAVAVRDQYPSLTLSASYISEAASAGRLFTDWITSLAGGLIAPLIDGGRRKAEILRNEAAREELLNLYGQTVLEAFQDVEDSLIREEKQKERIQNLEARLKLAQDTYEQLELGYLNGASEFISLLSAQTELQEIERDLLVAQRILIEFRIALYRALAGGFETQRENRDIKDS